MITCRLSVLLACCCSVQGFPFGLAIDHRLEISCLPHCYLRIYFAPYGRTDEVNVKLVRSVEVHRTHQVYIVGAKFRVFQKRGILPLDEFDALFGRGDFRRFLCAERDKAVPYVALIFFQPRFHLVHLLLRDHTPVVENARVLLQVL